MVRPGLFSAAERRAEAIKVKSQQRKTLRQSIFNEKRNIEPINTTVKKLTKEQIKREKLKEWQELKKKRLEEEKLSRKPPFRSFIVVRHTGTSPFKKERPKTRSASKVVSDNSGQSKLVIPSTHKSFNPKLNLPALPFPSVTQRPKRAVRNPTIAYPVLPCKTIPKPVESSNIGSLRSRGAPTRTAASGRLLKDSQTSKGVKLAKKQIVGKENKPNTSSKENSKEEEQFEKQLLFKSNLTPFKKKLDANAFKMDFMPRRSARLNKI